MMKRFIQLYRLPLVLCLVLIGFYITFAYSLERSDFTKLITLYSGLFGLSYAVLKQFKSEFDFLFGLGVVLRLVFLVSIPNLSQDFNRFIWDGHLILNGENPFLSTPLQWLTPYDPPFEIAGTLIDQMGSLNASHYSNYPPINQLLFAISSFLGYDSILGSVIALRTLIIVADVGILIMGRKLLEDLNLNPHAIFLYFLNPFIIIELTGNLHFEGVMLFFLVSALYLLYHGRWFWSAILLGLSVSTKLLPLIFLPLLWQFLAKERLINELPKRILIVKRSIRYYAIVGTTVIITFLPFLTATSVSHFWESIALWFNKFEFNASVFYIIREIGYSLKGYNVLTKVTPYLSALVIIFILFLSFFRKHIKFRPLVVAFTFSACFYFLLSTTVHPWYIATPLVLCIFTKYRFPLVWSFTVMLSYSAYSQDNFSENYLLLAIEYLAPLLFMLWELFYKKKSPKWMLVE